MRGLAITAVLATCAFVSWPVAKEAAIDRLVTVYMKDSGMMKVINEGEYSALTNTLAFSLMKTSAYSAFDQQDIGSQVVAVIRVLVLNDIPPIKAE